ncbi:MAG: YfhO family protein [Lachnospiraceae bacterium]|nr:YfhO family protein [Lachnospiraceae bacterium]
MMKKWFKEQENRISVFVFLAVMIVVCSPLITKLCINGHDLEYHLLRIESLKEGILIGKPFARINVLFFGGAGYASSLFYPDFLLYIPALLRAIGVSINRSYHIFVAICILLTYSSTYYCVKKMTESGYAALMAAILMVCSPYYLGDIYVRGAVGEFTAFIFLPFVIYGIYNVLYEEMDKPCMLGIGFAGVLLCHTNTFVFCALFAFLAFLIKWKKFKDNLSILWKLLITAGLAAGLTMFYWLPMIEMYFTTPLYVHTAWIGLEQTAVQLFAVLSNRFPSLGFLLVILAFFRALVKKNPQNRDLISFADWMLIGGAFFSVFATDLIPWQRLNGYLDFVQFPWRLFVPATAMLAVADAIILSVFIKSSLEPYMPSSSKVLTIVLLVVAMAFSIRTITDADITYYDYSDDYYSYKPYTANVIAGEWLPETVEDRDELVNESEHLYADTGEDLKYERIRDRVEADTAGSYQYVDVPFVYYKGYAASIQTGDQKESLSVTSGNNGLCRVMTNGKQGRLVVFYEGTFLQHLSTFVSLFTLLLLLVLGILRKRKAKIVAASLLLMMFCGCGMTGMNTDDELIAGNGASGQISADASVLEDNEQQEMQEEPEPAEQYRLLYVKDGYTGYDCKYIFLQCNEQTGKLTVHTTVGKTDDALIEEETGIDAGKGHPVLLCDLSSVREDGKYPLSVEITEENGGSVLLEEEIVIDKNRYKKLYNEAVSQPNPSPTVYACADQILAYEISGDQKLEKPADSARSQMLDILETYYNATPDDKVRFFTTAWLYKETGDKQYKKETEDYLESIPDNSKVINEPALFLGLAAYLRTGKNTDYALSEKAMHLIFAGANELLKDDPVAAWEKSFKDGNEDLTAEALNNAQLLMLANYVSNSAEYVKYAGNYLSVSGNGTGSLFVLSELSRVPL